MARVLLLLFLLLMFAVVMVMFTVILFFACDHQCVAMTKAVFMVAVFRKLR